MIIRNRLTVDLMRFERERTSRVTYPPSQMPPTMATFGSLDCITETKLSTNLAPPIPAAYTMIDLQCRSDSSESSSA